MPGVACESVIRLVDIMGFEIVFLDAISEKTRY